MANVKGGLGGNAPQLELNARAYARALILVLYIGLRFGYDDDDDDIVLRRLFEYKDQDHIRIDPESSPKRSNSIQAPGSPIYNISRARGGVGSGKSFLMFFDVFDVVINF